MAAGRGREGTAGAGYFGGAGGGAGSGSAAGRGGGGGGGGGFFGYDNPKDMIDGGGKGKSGPTFEGGGALSRAGNAMGIAPVGSRAERDGTGSFGLPDPMSGRVSSVAGIDVSRRGEGTGALGLPDPMSGRISGLARSPGDAPMAAPMRGDRDRPVMQTPVLPPVLPPVVPPTVSPSGGQDDLMTGEEVSRLNAERSRVPTYEAGGYVGKGGQPIRPSTASLDLPPALARMLDMPMQSYAEGGMVGPGGMPQRPMGASPMAMNVAQQGGAPVVGLAPQGGQGRPLNFAAIDQQAQQFMQQNPQQVEQIRAQVQQAMAAGEVDEQSLNMFVQVATTALQNPEMWPQLRQVLIQQGMLDAEDIGAEYDQGFLIILYIIGKTMGGGQMTTPAPMSAGQAPQMSMAKGGPLPAKSKNPDGSIPINAHEGEYVIPADVVRRLGTDHLDKMIAKTRGADGKERMSDDDYEEGEM